MPAWLLALVAPVAFVAAPAGAASDFAYTQKVGAGETALVVIDTRPLAECKQAALPGARCLPAADLLGPQRELPGERDLLWLFGALGLSGEEAVLVVGDTASSRDFVGGLLYLAGQRRVSVLDQRISPLLADGRALAPGQERGLLRTAVFTQPMRDALWLVHPREWDGVTGQTIQAPDAYSAIIRFTRHVAAGAAGGEPVRVGWHPITGSKHQ